LDWNARRLAVLDHDIDAIIRTHGRDRQVAAWLQDTAEAFEEIGEMELALDWAKRAAEFDRGHQSLTAAGYWCRLLDEHRPAESCEARLWVFRRWPSASTATRLYEAAGDRWPGLRDEILTGLAGSPRDAVLFALHALKEPELAWTLAHTLTLDNDDAWSDLVKVHGRIDPLAVLPVHRRLVEHELVNTGAEHYRRAARRLATMRRLAGRTSQATDVDDFIADLRDAHRRRPRLQQEFDRAGLPPHR
jgi:hypothetical protein